MQRPQPIRPDGVHAEPALGEGDPHRDAGTGAAEAGKQRAAQREPEAAHGGGGHPEAGQGTAGGGADAARERAAVAEEPPHRPGDDRGARAAENEADPVPHVRAAPGEGEPLADQPQQQHREQHRRHDAEQQPGAHQGHQRAVQQGEPAGRAVQHDQHHRRALRHTRPDRRHNFQFPDGAAVDDAAKPAAHARVGAAAQAEPGAARPAAREGAAGAIPRHDHCRAARRTKGPAERELDAILKGGAIQVTLRPRKSTLDRAPDDRAVDNGCTGHIQPGIRRSAY